MSKDAAAEVLVPVIRKVLCRDQCLAQVESAPLHQKLSKRELQILRLFGAKKTVKEIAHKLTLSTTTVSTYRTRILNKLDLKTTTDIISYALHNNLT